MKLPIVSYRPDDDPTAPAVITSGNGFVPSTKGIKGAPTPVSTTLPPLAQTCKGALTVVKLDDSTRFFAATSTKIYEAQVNAWLDRSAGVYTAVNNRWRGTQYGDVTIFGSKENLLQVSTNGDFSNISGSIRADIVITVGLFVMAFNTDDTGGVGIYGDRPNSWWCSGLSNHTTWTPSIATQAATGILTGVSGKITAGHKFGNQVVAYKEKGISLGSYAGPPFTFAWDDIPSDTGTWCQESVANIGTPEEPKHFFVGQQDFYVFNGARPVPVGDGIRETFFRSLNAQEADKICLLHSRKDALVYVFYPAGSSNTPNACVVWHYLDGRWGVVDRAVEYVCDYIQSSITYGELGTFYTTYGSLPNANYGDAFVTQAGTTPAIFNPSHAIQTLNGAPSSAHFITGDYGDDVNFGLLTRVKPMWLTKPASAKLSCFGRDSIGDALVPGPSANMSLGRFDVLTSRRWHRLRLDVVSAFEMSRAEVVIIPAGSE